MSDPERLAKSAARVAEFAAAVAACRAAGADAGALLQSWVRRAALAHQWPEVRAVGPAPECPDLVARARLLAERCREHRPGVLGKTLGWLQRAPDTATVLGATAVTLDDLAGALERADALGTGLAGVVADWLAPGSAAARLCALQTRLADHSGAAHGLLDRLSATADAPVPERAPDGGSGAAALETVRRIVRDLAERSADEALWGALSEWATEWFAAFGPNGRLLLSRTAGANSVGVEEVFTLRQAPHRSVVLRVEPGPVRAAPIEATPAPLPAPAGGEPKAHGEPWSNLPAPPEWPGLIPEPLVEWGSRTGTRPSLSATRARFERWLPTSSGRAWFARCLSVAEREPGGAASRWWAALRAAGWCRAYPDLDPGAEVRVPVWPDDVSAPVWPVHESLAADGPVGRIVEVRVYAPEPAEARFIVSDGWPEPGSPLERFHALYAAVGPVPAWWSDGLWEEARSLALAPPPDQERPAALIGRWLALLTPDSTESGVVGAVRAWAGAFGLELVAPVVGTPSAEEQEAIENRDVCRVFSEVPEGRVVRATHFGLTGAGRVFHRGAVEVSLGPVPTGLLELEAAAERLPAADPLRERVARLREALRGDYLREAALELYVDYWGTGGASVRATASTAGHEFARHLTEFLRGAFGLSTFVPQSIHDHPDGWLAVVPGGRAVTGLVRRVHRPGLHDEHGNLRIPALVEVE